MVEWRRPAWTGSRPACSGRPVGTGSRFVLEGRSGQAPGRFVFVGVPALRPPGNKRGTVLMGINAVSCARETAEIFRARE